MRYAAKASKQEIIRRLLSGIKPPCKRGWQLWRSYKLKLLMNQAKITPEMRSVVGPCLKRAEELSCPDCCTGIRWRTYRYRKDQRSVRCFCCCSLKCHQGFRRYPGWCTSDRTFCHWTDPGIKDWLSWQQKSSSSHRWSPDCPVHERCYGWDCKEGSCPASKTARLPGTHFCYAF